MRIGYNTWSAAMVPYEEFIPALSDIGFTAIAISVVPSYPIGGRVVRNAAAIERLSAGDRQRIKQAFKERDLKLPSIIGNQSLMHEDPAVNELAMSHLRASVDLCVELAPDEEVPTMNTGTGGHTGDLDIPSKRDMVLDRLGMLASYAAERGVVVCLEPHVNAPVDTVERAVWLVSTVDSPSLRLDFDVSHFEVVGVPMDQTVPRLVPLSGAAEIKDQHYRVASSGEEDDGWWVKGNGGGRAIASDGKEVEFQFLLAGEGTFDLPHYLQLMQAQGFSAPIAFEASVQCQARPGYDALASAKDIYNWMASGWRRAGVSTD
jgi:inosose dehydratase